MEVIIKTKHFIQSSGWSHKNSLSMRVEDKCPLWGALHEMLPNDYLYVGSHIVETGTSAIEGSAFNIPKEWNEETVQALVDRAKAGEELPDYHLNLEEHEK